MFFNLFATGSSGRGPSAANPRMNEQPITSKTTERGTLNVSNMTSYGFSGMQGWRVTMEDAHIMSSPIPVHKRKPLQGHALFGVMDGHGGGFTSMYASQHFVETFSSQPQLKDYSQMRDKDKYSVPGVELLKAALSKTFEVLDTDIRKQQNMMNDKLIALSAKKGDDCNIRYERSGSTCIVVLVTPNHIICANSGDSRAIMRRDGKTLPLSFDHKPTDISELERITAADGIVKNKRVDGDLAVSRGLGDFTYKSNESKTLAEQKVVPYPDFVVYPRNHEKDEFMVIACDGIFDVSTNEQCSTFVQELLDEGENDIGMICEEAMDTCLERNSRDNMTFAMVGFTGIKMRSGFGARNAVWQRRVARQARYLSNQAMSLAMSSSTPPSSTTADAAKVQAVQS